MSDQFLPQSPDCRQFIVSLQEKIAETISLSRLGARNREFDLEILLGVIYDQLSVTFDDLNQFYDELPAPPPCPA